MSKPPHLAGALSAVDKDKLDKEINLRAVPGGKHSLASRMFSGHSRHEKSNAEGTVGCDKLGGGVE